MKKIFFYVGVCFLSLYSIWCFGSDASYTFETKHKSNNIESVTHILAVRSNSSDSRNSIDYWEQGYALIFYGERYREVLRSDGYMHNAACVMWSVMQIPQHLLSASESEKCRNLLPLRNESYNSKEMAIAAMVRLFNERQG